MDAIIQKTVLLRINNLFKKHKPQGLGFSDNDAVIISIKIAGGKEFSETFYCRLKGDGTLGHSITKASEKRQKNLHDFIKKYISKSNRYNVRNNLGEWKGKEVEVEELDGEYIVKL